MVDVQRSADLNGRRSFALGLVAMLHQDRCQQLLQCRHAFLPGFAECRTDGGREQHVRAALAALLQRHPSTALA